MRQRSRCPLRDSTGFDDRGQGRIRRPFVLPLAFDISLEVRRRIRSNRIPHWTRLAAKETAPKVGERAKAIDIPCILIVQFVILRLGAYQVSRPPRSFSLSISRCDAIFELSSRRLCLDISRTISFVIERGLIYIESLIYFKTTFSVLVE